MEDYKILLIPGSEDTSSFVSEGVATGMQALSLLPESVRVKRERDRHATSLSLPQGEERIESQSQSLTVAARTFLAQYVSLGVLEVFPEWQGILITFPTLVEAVWVVRDPQHGQRLSQETRQPFILLNDLLAQEGHSTEREMS